LVLEIFKSYKESFLKSWCWAPGNRLDAGQGAGCSEIRFKGQQTETSLGTKFCVLVSRSLKYSTPLHLRTDFKVSFQRINVDSLRNEEVETDIKERYNNEY
jgi:hypothetical protein